MKQSNLSKAEFEACQRRAYKPELGKPLKIYSLKKDMPVRWNSTYIMLKYFLKCEDAVWSFQNTAVGREHGVSFTIDELKMAKDAKEVLKPIYDVTVEISGEHYITGSKIIPLTKVLLQGYTTMVRDSQYRVDRRFIHIFSDVLHKNLYHHLSKVEEMDLLRLSTICDPRYRKIAFRSPEKAAVAVEALKTEMSLIRSGNVSTDTAVPGPSSRVQGKKSSVWDSFDQEVENSHVRRVDASSSEDISTEVFKYLRMRNLPREKDPLYWWNEIGKDLFPRIYKVARKYLLVLGSSVPSERIFSSGGLTISARRCNLDEEVAEASICIHENLKKPKKKKDSTSEK